MAKETFKIFNIESPVSQLIRIGTKFEQIYSFEDYDETEAWISKEVYHHDMEDDPKDNFDYRYVINAYHNTEIPDDNNTYYHLYMVPCYSSLSKEKKTSVLDCCGIEETDVNEIDVFDCGYTLVIATESQEGEFSTDTMDKIASCRHCS